MVTLTQSEGINRAPINTQTETTAERWKNPAKQLQAFPLRRWPQLRFLDNRAVASQLCRTNTREIKPPH